MMADSASESGFQSNKSGSRYIGNSFFNIPGLFVGCGFKGSSDSESVKSPSSPLDFSLFSNLSSQLSLKPPKSPNQNGHQNKWHSSQVGLGIINLLVDEPKSTGLVLSSSKRKNVIFGSDVRTGYSERSKSFPADYMLLLLSQSETPKSSSSSSIADAFSGKSGVPLEPESFQNSSSASLSPKSHLSSKKFCSENRTTTMSSSSLFSNSSLDVKTSSLPVPIGSLSASEIELSEDYTCIISYGPNPKTTHIFGDCILECHTNDLPNLNNTENPSSDSLDNSTPFPSDEFLSFCNSCKKKLEEGDDIYIYRGEKAFCSSDCRSEDIFAEDEIGKSCCDPQNSSPASSYHEDIFLTGPVYKASAGRESLKYSQQLYDKYKEIILDYMNSTGLTAVRELRDEYMLRELVERWSNHKIMVRCLSCFSYSERYFVPQMSLPALEEVGLACFRELVYQEVKGKARDAVIVLIDRERDGERIDRALLKKCIGHLLRWEWDQWNAMKKSLRKIFSRKASNWILDDSCPDYMLKSEECLKKERDRVSHYLHSSTEPKLVERVLYELLAVHANQLLKTSILDVELCFKMIRWRIFRGCIGALSRSTKRLRPCFCYFQAAYDW